LASMSCAISPPAYASYDVLVHQLAVLRPASSRPPFTGWLLPFASSYRLITTWFSTVICLQRTFTSLVHAHAGRTQGANSDANCAALRLRRTAWSLCARTILMRDSWVPQSAKRFSNYLSRLRDKRVNQSAELRKTRPPRKRLTELQRASILNKTNAHCHICGGKINGDWHADHVLSYSKGGGHSEENYLAAHSTCNNYRWHYGAEEFQEIMKLGIWTKTQITRQTKLGMEVAEEFVKYEKNRIKRHKSSN
jgi:5-methylcytosine-specific restriction endonuclease McrA